MDIDGVLISNTAITLNYQWQTQTLNIHNILNTSIKIQISSRYDKNNSLIMFYHHVGNKNKKNLSPIKTIFNLQPRQEIVITVNTKTCEYATGAIDIVLPSKHISIPIKYDDKHFPVYTSDTVNFEPAEIQQKSLNHIFIKNESNQDLFFKFLSLEEKPSDCYGREDKTYYTDKLKLDTIYKKPTKLIQTQSKAFGLNTTITNNPLNKILNNKTNFNRTQIQKTDCKPYQSKIGTDEYTTEQQTENINSKQNKCNNKPKCTFLLEHNKSLLEKDESVYNIDEYPSEPNNTIKSNLTYNSEFSENEKQLLREKNIREFKNKKESLIETNVKKNLRKTYCVEPILQCNENSFENSRIILDQRNISIGEVLVVTNTGKIPANQTGRIAVAVIITHIQDESALWECNLLLELCLGNITKSLPIGLCASSYWPKIQLSKQKIDFGQKNQDCENIKTLICSNLLNKKSTLHWRAFSNELDEINIINKIRALQVFWTKALNWQKKYIFNSTTKYNKQDNKIFSSLIDSDIISISSSTSDISSTISDTSISSISGEHNMNKPIWHSDIKEPETKIIAYKPVSFFDKNFSIYPLEKELQPYENIKVSFRYKPTTLGAHNLNLNLIGQPGFSPSLKIAGVSVDISKNVCIENINIGVLFQGEVREINTIFNNNSVDKIDIVLNKNIIYDAIQYNPSYMSYIDTINNSSVKEDTQSFLDTMDNNNSIEYSLEEEIDSDRFSINDMRDLEECNSVNSKSDILEYVPIQQNHLEVMSINSEVKKKFNYDIDNFYNMTPKQNDYTYNEQDLIHTKFASSDNEYQTIRKQSRAKKYSTRIERSTYSQNSIDSRISSALHSIISSPIKNEIIVANPAPKSMTPTKSVFPRIEHRTRPQPLQENTFSSIIYRPSEVNLMLNPYKSQSTSILLQSGQCGFHSSTVQITLKSKEVEKSIIINISWIVRSPVAVLSRCKTGISNLACGLVTKVHVKLENLSNVQLRYEIFYKSSDSLTKRVSIYPAIVDIKPKESLYITVTILPLSYGPLLITLLVAPVGAATLVETTLKGNVKKPQFSITTTRHEQLTNGPSISLNCQIKNITSTPTLFYGKLGFIGTSGTTFLRKRTTDIEGSGSLVSWSQAKDPSIDSISTDGLVALIEPNQTHHFKLEAVGIQPFIPKDLVLFANLLGNDEPVQLSLYKSLKVQPKVDPEVVNFNKLRPGDVKSVDIKIWTQQFTTMQVLLPSDRPEYALSYKYQYIENGINLTLVLYAYSEVHSKPMFRLILNDHLLQTISLNIEISGPSIVIAGTGLIRNSNGVTINTMRFDDIPSDEIICKPLVIMNLSLKCYTCKFSPVLQQFDSFHDIHQAISSEVHEFESIKPTTTDFFIKKEKPAKIPLNKNKNRKMKDKSDGISQSINKNIADSSRIKKSNDPIKKFKKCEETNNNSMKDLINEKQKEKSIISVMPQISTIPPRSCITCFVIIHSSLSGKISSLFSLSSTPSNEQPKKLIIAPRYLAITANVMKGSIFIAQPKCKLDMTWWLPVIANTITVYNESQKDIEVLLKSKTPYLTSTITTIPKRNTEKIMIFLQTHIDFIYSSKRSLFLETLTTSKVNFTNHLSNTDYRSGKFYFKCFIPCNIHLVSDSKTTSKRFLQVISTGVCKDKISTNINLQNNQNSSESRISLNSDILRPKINLTVEHIENSNDTSSAEMYFSHLILNQNTTLDSKLLKNYIYDLWRTIDTQSCNIFFGTIQNSGETPAWISIKCFDNKINQTSNNRIANISDNHSTLMNSFKNSFNLNTLTMKTDSQYDLGGNHTKGDEYYLNETSYSRDLMSSDNSQDCFRFLNNTHNSDKEIFTSEKNNLRNLDMVNLGIPKILKGFNIINSSNDFYMVKNSVKVLNKSYDSLNSFSNRITKREAPLSILSKDILIWNGVLIVQPNTERNFLIIKFTNKPINCKVFVTGQHGFEIQLPAVE